MKLTETIISFILKKGLTADLHNVETTIDVPNTTNKAKIKIDRVTITIMRDDEGDETDERKEIQ